MVFGFEPKKGILGQDVNSLDELQKFLDKEVRKFSEFESQLVLELREIKHMEENIKQLEIQLKAVEVLMKQYNDLNQKLYLEMHKKDNVDTKKCREYVNMLNKIRSELAPLNNKMVTESEKLFLQETHKIYAKSESDKSKMEEIDRRAREIVSKMILMDKQIKGVEEGFGQFVNILNQLEEEQRQNIQSDKPIKGFHA